MRMKGKAVIVTGGAKGIGREIGLTFAKEGANLAIADVDTENLKLTGQKIEKLGRSVITSKVDISQSQEVRDFVETVADKFDGIDVLINCAALIIYKKFLDFDEEAWRRMLDVNLTGYFLFSQAVAKRMVQKSKGRIIHIASLAAELGTDRAAAYSASKAGVLGLTRVMAVELGPLGINVNAISPGSIDTEQARSLLTEDEIKLRMRMIPLERYGQPEEVAKAALFLASEDATYINGEILHIDGGVSGTRR